MMHLVYRMGQSLALSLPIKKSYKIADVIADILCFFGRDDRRNIAHNLKIVLGTDDKKLIKEHTKNIFRNFAKYLVDFARFTLLDKKYIESNIQIIGRENVEAALAKGKGVIMLSAHIGNWEMGAAVIGLSGYPFNAIILDHKNEKVNAFFKKQRSFCNIKPISLGGQLKNCFRALRENELLAIVGDRDLTNTGIEAEFFGRPAVLPKGAALLALKTGAAIVPTFLVRMKGDTFRLVFEKPVEYKLTGDKKTDTERIMRAYLPVIEKYIKEFPGQWYAFKKIWQ